MGQRQLRSGENAGGVHGCDDSGARSQKSGLVGPSVPNLVLRRRPGRSTGPGRLTPKVGAGDDPSQDAQPTPHRLPLLVRAGRRSPLRRRPAIGQWSPRQLVHLSAVCRDSSDRGSRKRVCTIATRNKTSHRSAQVCDPLQALFFSAPFVQYWGCTGVWFLYRRGQRGHSLPGTEVNLPSTGGKQ